MVGQPLTSALTFLLSPLLLFPVAVTAGVHAAAGSAAAATGFWLQVPQAHASLGLCLSGEIIRVERPQKKNLTGQGSSAELDSEAAVGTASSTLSQFSRCYWS